jgi:DNA (cytosine-5)-methyltransferase 1
MRFVSLFAGVGGFDLGLERSGHTCIGQVEIDKHARKVLEHHFPNVPKHDDVTTAIDWADEIGLTGNTELVVGGFPCQDLSVAGKRAGLAGERSGLFYDALRFATHTQAETIILENVPGLLSSNKGRDFGAVLVALDNAGYSNIQWRVLNSQFFGVPQRRRRVFIVASVGTKPFKQILFESKGSAGDSSPGEPQGQDITGAVADGTGTSSRGTVSPTLTAYNLDSRSPQSEEQQRIVGAVLEAQTGTSRRGGIGSDLVQTLAARDYKGVGNQYVQENKLVVDSFTGTSFGGYGEGVGTLRAEGGDLGGGSETLVVREES